MNRGLLSIHLLNIKLELILLGIYFNRKHEYEACSPMKTNDSISVLTVKFSWRVLEAGTHFSKVWFLEILNPKNNVNTEIKTISIHSEWFMIENSFPVKEKSAEKAEDKTVFGLMSRFGPDKNRQESLGP